MQKVLNEKKDSRPLQFSRKNINRNGHYQRTNVKTTKKLTKGRTIRKVMGGEGNFRAARIFFRYQILCMNFI